MTDKIHAYQIAPECQESPLFFGDMLDSQIEYFGIILTGNSDYNEHCPARFVEALERAKYNGWSDDKFCKILSKLDGREYTCSYLRGCCQSDWVMAYYPSVCKKLMELFEVEYFNTGTEWCIDDGYDAYHVYVYDGWNKDTYAKEIAEAIDEDVANIEVHEFVGWSQSPLYN